MTLQQLDQAYIWHPFTQAATAPPSIPLVSAKGAVLYGQDGRTYLDLISSWWVNTHGHCHPSIANAIAKQAQTLEHVIFAGFTHEPAVQLAQTLVTLLPPSLNRVFFSDNGSTAVEIALKMARQYWVNQKESRRRRFLAFSGGYHGDTFGAMAVGRSSGFYAPFHDLLMTVDFIPYPDTWEGDPHQEAKEDTALKTLQDYLRLHKQEVIAFILEPLIQGASGMRVCRPSFLTQLLTLLKQAGILIIFDEVMTGFGRTGSLFALEQLPLVPDFLCLSKGLTGGFIPLALTVCGENIYQAFLGPTFDQAFAHAHSFTANPLGCAAALASLRLFEEEKTLKRIEKIHLLHQQRLQELTSLSLIKCPRVIGSIAAWNLDSEQSHYTAQRGKLLAGRCLEKGFFLRPLGNVIYILPPYCITEAELNAAYDCIIQESQKL